MFSSIFLDFLSILDLNPDFCLSLQVFYQKELFRIKCLHLSPWFQVSYSVLSVFGPFTSFCLDLFLSCPWFQIIYSVFLLIWTFVLFHIRGAKSTPLFFSSFRTSVGPFFFISVRGFKSFSRSPQYFVPSP